MSHNRIKLHFSQNESKEIISEIDKNFLMAVRRRDYVECANLLKAGANINTKFGKYAQDSHDACSFCGPNDTPLTHAVKKEDVQLVEFLLKNRAKTEIVNLYDETPLMQASFQRNAVIVKLLLDAKADPNTKSNSGLSAVDHLFLGLRAWCLDTQKPKCMEIFTLLVEAGFTGEFREIADRLTTRGYHKSILDLFSQICSQQKIENFYTIGAVAQYKQTSQAPTETKEDTREAFKIREQVIKEYLLKHLYKKEENGTYTSCSTLRPIYYHLENIFIIKNEDNIKVEKPKKFGTMVIDLPKTDPRSRTIHNEEMVVDITEQELNDYVKLLAESKYELNEELLKNAKQSSQIENTTESLGLWGTNTTTTNLSQDNVSTTKPKPTRFRDKI